MAYLDAQSVLATIALPVTKLTAVEPDAIRVWPYVDALEDSELRGHSIAGFDIACVYRGADGNFDHVLIPTRDLDLYLVVVVDRSLNAVVGHHVANRKALYT